MFHTLCLSIHRTHTYNRLQSIGALLAWSILLRTLSADTEAESCARSCYYSRSCLNTYADHLDGKFPATRVLFSLIFAVSFLLNT